MLINSIWSSDLFFLSENLLSESNIFKKIMKKTISLLIVTTFLTGCIESMALLGPATTGVGSGKIAQSAASSVVSYGVKKAVDELSISIACLLDEASEVFQYDLEHIQKQIDIIEDEIKKKK